MRTFELDSTAGTAPMTVTARLFTTSWQTWRWLLDGVIHLPHDGMAHTFQLDAGTHQISVRGVKPDGTVEQDEEVRVVVASPRDRFWRLQTFELIPDEWAAGLVLRDWGGVRVEGTNYGAIMAQCQRHALWPLWILDRGEHLTVPGGIDCEIGNECNAGIGKWPRLSPQEYSAWVREAAPVLRAKGCQVYIGALNNQSKEAMNWLRDVLALIPPDERRRLRLSTHYYLDPDMDTSKPKHGFKTLAEQDAYWIATTQGLPWAHTEGGIVDASYRDWSSWRYFGKKRERKAVDGHRALARRLRLLGCEFYTVFQVNDGPGDGFDNRCGIRTVGGQWKPTADLPRLAG